MAQGVIPARLLPFPTRDFIYVFQLLTLNLPYLYRHYSFFLLQAAEAPATMKLIGPLGPP